jgi:hypothetical protein
MLLDLAKRQAPRAVRRNAREGREGKYTFGSGENTLYDCATATYWWVAGKADIVSSLQKSYVEARPFKGATLAIQYGGIFRAAGSTVFPSDRVYGELELQHFNLTVSEVDNSECD